MIFMDLNNDFKRCSTARWEFLRLVEVRRRNDGFTECIS